MKPTEIRDQLLARHLHGLLAKNKRQMKCWRRIHTPGGLLQIARPMGPSTMRSGRRGPSPNWRPWSQWMNGDPSPLQSATTTFISSVMQPSTETTITEPSFVPLSLADPCKSSSLPSTLPYPVQVARRLPRMAGLVLCSRFVVQSPASSPKI